MDDRGKTGKTGEELAASWLEGRGIDILERNWRYGHKEIDIIARKGDELLIVEVKTIKKGMKRSAGMLVDRRKQEFLIEAAEAYIMASGPDLELRFDIVLVDLSKAKHSIRYIERAFYPTL